MVSAKIQSMRQSWSVNNLTDFVVESVQTAPADEAPFYHLRFDRVFPDDFYAEMLEAMPVAEDYRAMSGKSKMGSSRPDGKPTRAKIDLSASGFSIRSAAAHLTFSRHRPVILRDRHGFQHLPVKIVGKHALESQVMERRIIRRRRSHGIHHEPDQIVDCPRLSH